MRSGGSPHCRAAARNQAWMLFRSARACADGAASCVVGSVPKVSCHSRTTPTGQNVPPARNWVRTAPALNWSVLDPVMRTVHASAAPQCPHSPSRLLGWQSPKRS